MGGKTTNKAGYFDKLKGLLEEYKSIFIVTVDNVSSQQMHKIRRSLRGDGEVQGVVLMGKNTMVRPSSCLTHSKLDTRTIIEAIS
jgi:large subunit ribosomal protein LP0